MISGRERKWGWGHHSVGEAGCSKQSWPRYWGLEVGGLQRELATQEPLQREADCTGPALLPVPVESE